LRLFTGKIEEENGYFSGNNWRYMLFDVEGGRTSVN
jgi:hypothetical protein